MTFSEGQLGHANFALRSVNFVLNKMPKLLQKIVFHRQFFVLQKGCTIQIRCWLHPPPHKKRIANSCSALHVIRFHWKKLIILSIHFLKFYLDPFWLWDSSSCFSSILLSICRTEGLGPENDFKSGPKLVPTARQN